MIEKPVGLAVTLGSSALFGPSVVLVNVLELLLALLGASVIPKLS